MRAKRNADGSLTLGEVGGALEIDEVAPYALGDRLILDPQNPRRAIPDPAEPARRAAAAKLETAIAEEMRVLVLERLVAKGEPGAAEALVAAQTTEVKVEAREG